MEKLINLYHKFEPNVPNIVNDTGAVFILPIVYAILLVLGNIGLAVGFIFLLMNVWNLMSSDSHGGNNKTIITCIIILVVMGLLSSMGWVFSRFFGSPTNSSEVGVNTVANGITNINNAYIKPTLMAIIGLVGVAGLVYAVVIIALELFKFFKEDKQTRGSVFSRIGFALLIAVFSGSAVAIAGLLGVS